MQGGLACAHRDRFDDHGKKDLVRRKYVELQEVARSAFQG